MNEMKPALEDKKQTYAVWWHDALEGEGIACPSEMAAALADCFKLNREQILQTAFLARLRATALSFDEPDLEDITSAARLVREEEIDLINSNIN